MNDPANGHNGKDGEFGRGEAELDDAPVEEQLNLADGEERLPWLESDDDYDDGTFDFSRLMIVGLVGLLVILGLLFLLTRFWGGSSTTEDGLQAEGTTIAAPDEPYRSRPDDPGGSEVAGTGDVSFEVSEGQARDAQLAEEDNPRPSIDREQSGDDDAASAGGVGIQVAAFTSRDRAVEGWSELVRRYEALQGLDYRIERASVDGATVYRLQAVTGTEATANAVCRAIKAAGGDCQVKP